MTIREKAIASYQALLRSRVHDPRIKEAYAAMKNTYTKKDLRKNVEAFAKGFLDAEHVKKITNATRIVTTAEFKDRLTKCLVWLKENIGQRPYGIILGRPLTTTPLGMGNWIKNRIGKSALWLAHLIEEHVGRPAALYLDHTTTGMSGARQFIEERDIHTWCFLDDGIYSGKQVREYVGFIDRHRIWDDGRHTLLIAAAFATAQLGQVFRHPSHVRFPTVKVFTGERMDSLHDVFNVSQHNIHGRPIVDRLDNTGATLTIMPHKVPDEVSFGFTSNDKVLVPEDRIKVPYKQFTMKALPSQVRINQHGTVYHGYDDRAGITYESYNLAPKKTFFVPYPRKNDLVHVFDNTHLRRVG